MQIEALSNELMIARRSDGTLWCWGADAANYCSDGGRAWATRTEVDCVESASFGGLAIAAHPSGGITIWGGLTSSYIGSDPVGDSAPLSAPIRTVAAGGGHAILLDVDGGVWLRGRLSFSWMADDMIDSPDAFLRLPFPAPAVSISDGSAVCAVLSTGAVACVGVQHGGSLGLDPEITALRTPTVIAIDEPVQEIATSISSCALLVDGKIQCAGPNSFGQLGRPRSDDPQPSFVTVEGVPPAQRIKWGTEGFNACALSHGSVWCWGSYAFEALHPSDQGTILPTRVEPFDDVVDFAVSTFSLCVLREDGSMWCRGYGARGNCSEGFDWTEVSFEECWTI
ncbi:MAG: hypothetical protein IPM79_35830 [Polyangiaceae bacterium]|nr:hypothetical protein [Polyangiaceae bacterium]MBK8942828.1 hypothetical protein [Polyangiaceae bacterium]